MKYRTVILRSHTAAVLLLALSVSALLALCAAQRIPMADALVYRAEGSAVVTGSDLYGFTVTEWRLPATYPPFAAILFVPTSWLPLAILKAVFVAGNAALLTLLVWLSCRFAGLRATIPTVCAASAAALWLEPVFQTLLFGQINLALACLVLWDLSRTSGAIGKGFALGIAAGVKLTPAVFILYLLVTRRVREGLTGLAAFVGTVLLGALALPAASVEFWTRRVFETDRVGRAWIVDNQSLQGLVARALGDASPGLAWAVPAAAVAVGGLWLARRVPDDRWGILLIAVTALLVSPISWSHHWVWCVPLIALLVAEGRPRLATGVAVLFTARTLWLVPHQGDLDLRLPWWQQPLASPYPLLGVGLLAAMAVRRPVGPALALPAPRGERSPGPGLRTG